MRNRHIFIICFVFVTAPFSAFASGVIFNEIAWMGSPPKEGETSSAAANNEWIELKNTGQASVDITGWSLSAEDGTPSISLTGSISAGSFFLLERTSDDTVSGITADMIYTGALSNVGEKLTLKDGTGTIIDDIDASAGWPAGSAETKETMQKKGEVWITALATPRAENMANQVSLPSPTPVSVPSPSSVSSPPSSPVASSAPSRTFIKTIKAYAGEDIRTMTGVAIQLLGYAKGLNDESIDSSARFFWNFGDGETQEGRSVTHIYRIPGIYMAGVHVSSSEYAASDFARIEVVQNKIAFSEVVSGQEGYIRLANNSDIEADIGGWSMRDSTGRAFLIPSHTLIAARGNIGIANSVSGLAQENGALPIVIFYPNGMQAIISGAISLAHNEKNILVHVSPISSPFAPTQQIPSRTPSPLVSVVSNLTPTSDTSPVLENSAYAAADASDASPLFFPLGIAMGISMLGAAGFFVSKKYF